ncbi:hypothetical protein [Burkholderia lata]|uniref:hypothetical protein n=1 Tax=Burkholderia lata (strain ATCC 17760 / DSM 23089 / LMG 22485 / NCIMB 9086 / R18194 / 383) TaxID=482957 RepID=UPI001584482D|nr:hypothetical protein [Burkholderia lata]
MSVTGEEGTGTAACAAADGIQSLGETARSGVEAGDLAIRRSGDPAIRRSGDPAIQQSSNPAIQQSGNPAIRQSGNPAIRQSGCAAPHSLVRWAFAVRTGSPPREPYRQPIRRTVTVLA